MVPVRSLPKTLPFDKNRRPPPKKCRGPLRPTGHRALHAGFSRIPGLCPNGFSRGRGSSGWDSSGANFARLRPLALIPPSLHTARAYSGGHCPHSVCVLVFRVASKTHFTLRARWAKWDLEKWPFGQRLRTIFLGAENQKMKSRPIE